mmetsp:Transcript_20086/g.59649  ORF Transcript_20086/g.59649 Transcript_20086/m.59649 type:complete len:326 (-) Transcript_20086:810-1787(-)
MLSPLSEDGFRRSASALALAAVNWMFREAAALIHISTMTMRMAPRYGVEAAREPKPMIMNCWMRAPPDLPSGLQMTSMAALPLTLTSSSRGMYAISLQGSNRAYLEPLEKMFWAAPTSTAAYSGVRPQPASVGARMSEPSTRAKKIRPVTSSMDGVTSAATPQPKRAKICLARIIIENVTMPVAVEKLPMNAEYSFGLGNWDLSFDFQVTSTRLMEIPYATTSVARSRMYGDAARKANDSPTLILAFFFFFDSRRPGSFGTTKRCRAQYRPQMRMPPITTMPIMPLRETPQPSTPGGRLARTMEKYFTAWPEKISATLAPRPNSG